MLNRLLAFLFFAFIFLIPIQPQIKSIHPDGKLIEVNGAKLWVEVEGKGEPLLIIPGGGREIPIISILHFRS